MSQIKHKLHQYYKLLYTSGIKDGNSLFNYWRIRIMYGMMVGYSGFYLVRMNLTMALPSLESEFGYSKTELGLIIFSFSLIYGAGKSFFGYLSDKSNARYFMTIGIIGSAFINIFMGFSSSLYLFIALWTVNGVFQSMGWPPCAKLLTHWFSAKEIATKWAFWNMSHQIGGAVVVILAGILIEQYGWRYAFFVPAAFAVVIGIFIFNRLRDTPQSLGLPSIEEHHEMTVTDDPDAELSEIEFLIKRVFRNKLVWYVCFANFFLYIVRMGILNWAPTFLREMKGSSLQLAGWQFAGFELAGIVGGLFAGYLSDKIFKGRRGPVGVMYMLGLSFFIFYFWKIPMGHHFLDGLAMIIVGFFVYGPQILVGVAATDFASKRAAGAASGLTGTFGYLASSISAVGIGWIVDLYGWDYAFIIFILSSIMGSLFFALTWSYRSKVLQALDD